jgi:hypothetical protein
MTDFGRYRDGILRTAELEAWPAVTVAGLGCIDGTPEAWLVAVEAATADELIMLSRLLGRAAAEGAA